VSCITFSTVSAAAAAAAAHNRDWIYVALDWVAMIAF
jgi:hypothetical protein